MSEDRFVLFVTSWFKLFLIRMIEDLPITEKPS
jgi:hypothetical protein